MNDPRKHNYFEKLRKFVEKNKPARGRIAEIDICHDDWCRIYKGGYCNCNPEIKFHLTADRN
jgi:hypothetical protein